MMDEVHKVIFILENYRSQLLHKIEKKENLCSMHCKTVGKREKYAVCSFKFSTVWSLQ